MRALIVEHGFNRGGLAAARALDRAGWTVDVVSSDASLTNGSRSARRRERIRYPEGGPEALLEGVRTVVREAGTAIVFPVDETQLLVLSRHREELGALLPYPDHDTVARATDRLEQALLAETAGLAPPLTTPARSADLSGRDGPVVVKARTPALALTSDGWSRFETQVGSAQEAASWVDEIEDTGTEAVVQTVLQGDLASMTVLTGSEGELIAEVQQTAGRIWPPGAGTSSRASTVAIDPELSRRVVAFLEALGWRGFAQLQFIVDADGVPHLIDFNPRFYGSLSLAIGAGVNFPVLWADSALGRPAAVAGAARVGVRYHWLGGDVRRAVRERRGGLVRDVGGSLAWGLSAVHPVWSVRDPSPALRSGITFVRHRLPI